MTTEAVESGTRANPAWKIALVALPLFLALSGAWAIWASWKRMKEPELDPRLALRAGAVEAAELDDHLRKLADLLGRRDWDTPAGRKNMRRAHIFIESTLSPQNYGFAVENGEHLTHAGEIWPTVWADLKGNDPEGRNRVLLVVAPYDLSDGEVAVVLAAANDLRDEEFRHTVRFVFYPAELYRSGAGKDIRAVLRERESFLDVIRTDLPHPDGTPPEPGTWTGVELKPVAEKLAGEVRELAQ